MSVLQVKFQGTGANQFFTKKISSYCKVRLKSLRIRNKGSTLAFLNEFRLWFSQVNINKQTNKQTNERVASATELKRWVQVISDWFCRVFGITSWMKHASDSVNSYKGCLFVFQMDQLSFCLVTCSPLFSLGYIYNVHCSVCKW